MLSSSALTRCTVCKMASLSPGAPTSTIHTLSTCAGARCTTAPELSLSCSVIMPTAHSHATAATTYTTSARRIGRPPTGFVVHPQSPLGVLVLTYVAPTRAPHQHARGPRAPLAVQTPVPHHRRLRIARGAHHLHALFACCVHDHSTPSPSSMRSARRPMAVMRYCHVNGLFMLTRSSRRLVR